MAENGSNGVAGGSDATTENGTIRCIFCEALIGHVAGLPAERYLEHLGKL